ncbi:hypothetical protein [Methylicorpusculum sp.]|uniref:hypothetical protein n=1 Tax=Methylicorpusculum sp. TaxID=2713644 RepID=UPI0027322AFF|nr:hypothetical protein [Methylicorpusculum sp.]MDP2178492.1 hypothetical protein [Methylicorpusculum sp.]MDP3530321.1 hypothetical protein [Methylicorpusculum sp.]MDZ4152137.1 hypothetical protein [Methylicorpusculum sp.]
MSMLTSLLKKLRPLVIEDTFFGSLTYIKLPKGRISYWEAKHVFLPTNREVELFIDAPAPEQPPNEVQRQFFLTVDHRFNEILSAAEAVLRPQFEEWCCQPLAEPFEVEFTMTSFSIPAASLEQANWEISFESKADANHLFTVAFSGLAATGVTVDG